jgi:hypothetical protein
MANKTSRYNITMDQGSTFSLAVVWNDENDEPVDLTGYSARMHIRQSYSNNTLIESMTSSNGEITITANTGQVTVTLPATRTASINSTANTSSTPYSSTYVYDLEVESSDAVVTKLIWGSVTIYKEVTV